MSRPRQDGGPALLAAALAYAERGWPVFPCHADKRPRTRHGFKDASCEAAAIEDWWRRWPTANVAIACGAAGLLVVDVDVKDEAPGRASWRWLVEQLGPELEQTACARTPSGGWHYYFRTSRSDLGSSVGELAPGIDVRARGGYVLAPPSRGVDGAAYRWLDDRGLERLAELPAALAARLLDPKPSSSAGPLCDDGSAPVIPAGRRNETLFGDGAAMRRRGQGRAEIAAALEQTNKRCEPPLGEEELARIIESVIGYRPGQPQERSLPQTDAGNSELFAGLHGERTRYDHRRGAWLLWESHCWRPDEDGGIYRLAIAAARRRYLAALEIADLEKRNAESRFAIKSEDHPRLSAMLRLAACQPPIATSGSEWNREPMLMAVGNGVLDLEQARLREGRPEEMIDRRSPVAFEPAAVCRRWERFLGEVFCGDEELIDWLWRVAGYLLSGQTSEQCLFLCYGTGANGKSKLLNVLRALLGEYAFNAPFSTFESNSRSQIPNDLAALVDRRLVTSSETNEHSQLNEARLKMLTGSDPVTARFLNREFFSYVPVAKFLLAFNHKPRIRDYTRGFWRRIRLIPFEARFEGENDEKDLEEKLLAELPGILAWAVRGCLEWQQRGLEAPARVRAATEDYRADSDPLAEFIEARLRAEEGARLRAAEGHAAYLDWAAAEGIPEQERLGRNRFYRLLESHYTKRHTREGNLYLGVRLADESALPFDELAVKA